MAFDLFLKIWFCTAVALPILFFSSNLYFKWLTKKDWERSDGMFLSLILAFAIWPVVLMFAIAIGMVIGLSHLFYTYVIPDEPNI